MSERTLKWLVGALAVVVVAWVAVTFLGGRSGPPAGSAEVTAFFQGLTPTAVSSIHIVGPKDTVSIAQQGGAWKVNGAAIDSADLADLWTDLKDAHVRDLVATNPKNHATLGVAADSTWKLTVDVSGGSRTLYVGNPGPTYTTVYVRLPHENDVYTVAGGLRGAVVRSVDGWRDKRIVALDSAAVARIDVKHGRNSFDLVRRHGGWSLGRGREADTATVRNILSELSDLSAFGFYHSKDSLNAEGGRLVALSGTGDTLADLTVGSGQGDRWIRSRGDSSLYRVAGYRVDRMMPKLSTLVAKPSKKKTTARRTAPAKRK